MHYFKKTLNLCGLFLILVGCKNFSKGNDSEAQNHSPNNKSILDNFEDEVDGRSLKLYRLENEKGGKVFLTNYGARVVSLLVPDKEGKLTDVVLGFASAKDYLTSTEPYYGATIGRFANRIHNGKFRLEGEDYQIPINNGDNSLHGGKKGFQDVIWEAFQTNTKSITFSYFSEHMEEGFPGNLEVKVSYEFTDRNELKINYEAKTDKTTVLNLTNHAFFNLNGEGNSDILGHILKINADSFTPVDTDLIPTGEIKKVEGTAFDFNRPKSIGKEINKKDLQLEYGGGYDHNYVLNHTQNKDLIHAATVIGDKTNIVLDIYTTEPGIQFYSGNFMNGENTLKSGVKDKYRTGFALETQHFPDSPNQPGFPSTILKPGEVFKSESVYAFSLK